MIFAFLLCLAATTLDLAAAAAARAHRPAGDASICEVLHKDWECTADEACAWSKELRHCDAKGASASLHPRGAGSASAAAAAAPTHSPPPSAAAPASAAAAASPDASAPFDAHPGVPDTSPLNEASASSADSTTPTSNGLRGAATSSGGPDHHAPAGSKFASFFRKLAKVRGASKGDEHHEHVAAAASPEGSKEGSKEGGKEKEKGNDKEAAEDDGSPCGSSSPPNPGMSEVVPSRVSSESPSTSSFVELHRRHRRRRARAGCEEEKELVKTNFLWQRIFKNKPYVPLPSRTHTFARTHTATLIYR
jgi:hypothetical protein